MKSELQRLYERLLGCHVSVIVYLCLVAGVALWKVRQGGVETPLWVAMAAGAFAGAAMMLRSRPGPSLARVLGIVDAFYARISRDTTARPLPGDLPHASEQLAHHLISAVGSGERTRKDLGTVLGAVTQELSQPLSTASRWLAYALAQERTPEERRIAIVQACDQAQRAAQATGALALLGQLGSAETSEKTAVNFLVERISEQLSFLAEARHVKLAIEGEGSGIVRGNAQLLEQALLKVIENALRYSPVGGSVRLAISRSEQQTCLDVSDDGPGIPPGELEHIFEPHYRGSLASQNGDGTGIGLVLARLIIECSGGSIQVENAADRGSCFHIALPLAP